MNCINCTNANTETKRDAMLKATVNACNLQYLDVHDIAMLICVELPTLKQQT